MRIYPGQFIELAPRSLTDDKGKPLSLNYHTRKSGVYVALEQFDSEGPVYYVACAQFTANHDSGDTLHINSAEVQVVRAFGDPARLVRLIKDLRAFADVNPQRWVHYCHAAAGALADRLQQTLPAKPIDTSCVDRAIQARRLFEADYSACETRMIAHLLEKAAGYIDDTYFPCKPAAAEPSVWFTLRDYMLNNRALRQIVRNTLGLDVEAFHQHGLDVRVRCTERQFIRFLVCRDTSGITNDWKAIQPHFGLTDPREGMICPGNRRGLATLMDATPNGQ